MAVERCCFSFRDKSSFRYSSLWIAVFLFNRAGCTHNLVASPEPLSTCCPFAIIFPISVAAALYVSDHCGRLSPPCLSLHDSEVNDNNMPLTIFLRLLAPPVCRCVRSASARKPWLVCRRLGRRPINSHQRVNEVTEVNSRVRDGS